MLPRPTVENSACPLHKRRRRVGENWARQAQLPKVRVNIMADIYVDYVLNEDNRKASSLGPPKSPFVAIGLHVWAVWQIVLRFKHRYHGEFTALSMVRALRDSVFGGSSVPYERAPASYPKNMYCKLFV